MENYTWNFKEIKEKLKYAKERLKKETNTKEREILMHSLLTYVNLLHSHDTINLKLTKLFDKLTKGKFSLIKDRKFQAFNDIVFDFKDYVYDDDFLLDLSKNVKEGFFENKAEPLKEINLTEEQLIEISRGFYKWLGDKELYEYANETLNSKNHLQFKNTEYRVNDFGKASGITYSDVLFQEVYIGMNREYTLFDAQALNHEIMHSIDFKMNQKLPSNSYYGFHEVPTYTIDYLFFDYLEEMGYDLKEVNKLRSKKIEYIKGLASFSILKLQLSSFNKFDLKNFSNERLKQGMNSFIRKDLLEVYSELIANTLYKQTKYNKEYGIGNLKKFINTNLPINKVPDFSFINISNQDLLDTSQNIGNEFFDITKPKII